MQQRGRSGVRLCCPASSQICACHPGPLVPWLCAGSTHRQAPLPVSRCCADRGCHSRQVAAHQLNPLCRGVTSGAESSSNGAGPGLRRAEPATGPQGGSGGGGSSNGAGPEDKQPRVPHRWRVVGMMALAFVLCNMDKVRAPRLPAHYWQTAALWSMDLELAGGMHKPAKGGTRFCMFLRL